MTASHTIPAGTMLQFHVLTAFPPHNVNRDEDGRPKTCLLGGALRGRISSQAKKRALRFAPHFPGSQRATRTREAGIESFRTLTSAGVDRESAVWAALAVNFALGGGKSPPTRKDAKQLITSSNKKGGSDDGNTATQTDGLLDTAAAEIFALEHALRTDQGLVVSQQELKRLRAGVAELQAAWTSNPQGFAATLEDWIKERCRSGLLTDTDHDLDTALFGRMVATNPTFNVDAACAVSHAFTTHSYTVEGDYFSAGEELNVLDETGAAITSYAFFGGGVYYQHAALDVSHLRNNLGEGRSGDEAAALTREALETFLKGLLFAQPKGKRNAFASDVAASYVLVSRGNDPAINLGLAFLNPVPPKKEADMMELSITRLREFHDGIRQSYGLRNVQCIYNAYPPACANAPADPEVRTYDALLRFVLEAAQ